MTNRISQAGRDDPTVFPMFDSPGWTDIVKETEPGDRVHLQLPHQSGSVRWRSEWVLDAGDEFIETESYRVEITDEDEHVRRTMGDGGVKLLESLNDEWVIESWTPSLNGIERIPFDALTDGKWYQWEVHVSEVVGGGVSTDQTVFPEAPSQAVAEEKGKRWADMERGYTPVVYQEQRIRIPPRIRDLRE